MMTCENFCCLYKNRWQTFLTFYFYWLLITVSNEKKVLMSMVRKRTNSVPQRPVEVNNSPTGTTEEPKPVNTENFPSQPPSPIPPIRHDVQVQKKF